MSTHNKALLTTSLLSPVTIKHSLLIAHRKVHQAILIAFMCFISMIFIVGGTAHADTTTPPATTPVKWHPGHYYSIMNKNSSWYLSQVYKELKATPALRGIHVRFSWAELEKTQGVYNFSLIDKLLSQLSAMDKRLIILFELRSFGPPTNLVPDYIRTNTYDGGIFYYDSYNRPGEGGGNIKLWNPQVHKRLVALMRALGKRFNSNAHFEGIGLAETALGMVSLSSTQMDGYYANMLSLQQQMRNYFPNTMTYQFTNYPRPILESFIGKLSTMGTALGGPDVFLEEPGLLFANPKKPKGVYHHYAPLSGVVPLTPAVMSKNYINTRADGTGYEPTVSELLAYARDTLKANYIFWTRHPDYYRRVLELLNMKNQKTTLSGGLDATCPSAYSSCTN
jgi:hypothetical protein